ncbi:MAG TPA: Asp-tRNA(Asn)/Glu-tRNA(Gln) amidotransferase GatCAB subunit B, partial [Nitrospirae bacterium]|nr:Asp-tRNA(Asn)/Glu-tRNA(Gln) amidotransferase GatCAB subunit B [Nitrospirota bacterium]
YDSAKDVTVSMRSKEEAHDYRYFPEPDLEPVVIDEQWIERARRQLPELPDARMERFVRQYDLPEYDAEVLTSGRPLADYFESAVKGAKSAKTVSNWVMGEVMRVLKEKNTSPADCRVKPDMLREMIGLIDSGAISGKIAKAVFEEMMESGARPAAIVEKKGLTQITDTSAIEAEVEKTIGANPKQVEDYKNGKVKLIGFFVGQVMKATKGKASPEVVNKILKEKLEKA